MSNLLTPKEYNDVYKDVDTAWFAMSLAEACLERPVDAPCLDILERLAESPVEDEQV